MFVFKRCIQLLTIAASFVLFNILRAISCNRPLPFGPAVQEVKFAGSSFWYPFLDDSLQVEISSPDHAFITNLHNGIPKPQGSDYTRVMVVPSLKSDNVSWIQKELPDIDTAIYVADDPTAPLHPPKNKGHEVMTYLTYIIDHYYSLPEILIFLHAHRWTHHNIEPLGHDSAEMVRRLRDDYIVRHGYMNLRCDWSPGCPEWLHPNPKGESLARQEEVVLFQCWRELFPSQPIPIALGQPCCAQFALSKARVLTIPRSRFIYLRDWMLKTPLSDYVSGRVWEYIWQFLFTGQSTYCPLEHECFCQGFGLCLEHDAPSGKARKSYDGKLGDAKKMVSSRDQQTTTDAKRTVYTDATTFNLGALDGHGALRA